MSHGAAYSDSIKLDKQTLSDNILKDKAYEIARNHKCDGYQRALSVMFYNGLYGLCYLWFIVFW